MLLSKKVSQIVKGRVYTTKVNSKVCGKMNTCIFRCWNIFPQTLKTKLKYLNKTRDTERYAGGKNLKNT